MKGNRIIAILLIVCSHKASAQDPHFSQFFSSPLTLNPAFTGKFWGNYRVAGNYRNQWPTINNAFVTGTTSVDFHIMQDKIASNDTWGVGIMGLNDKSAAGAVNFNYGSISTAYHKGLDEDGYHQIAIGFQATFANMLINTSQLTFEDQLTINGFTGITGELFNNTALKTNYMDLNAGVLYSGSSSDKNNFYAGFSLYHINRPRQQFTGALFQLNSRATIHTGGFFEVSRGIQFHASGMQSFQGGASQTILGGAFQLTANPEADKPTSLYAGAWVRFKDAFVPYLGLEFGDFRIGASYDINTSSLRTASQGVGGIEFSLIYIRRPNNDRPVPCPKF